MSTTAKFLILYLIPCFSVAGTFGTYMIGYGTRAEGLIKFVFMIVVSALIASCYITVKLVSQFIADETIYSGVIFSILGCLLEFIAFAFYIVMFKDELY